MLPCHASSIQQIGKSVSPTEESSIYKNDFIYKARLEVVSKIAAIANEQEIDAVLVAGDLFDSSTVQTQQVMEVIELIGEIRSPVFVTPGNHDHGESGGIRKRSTAII